MARYFEIAAVFAAIYIVYQGVNWWSLRRRFNEAARLHGCKPARKLPSWDPFLGLDIFTYLGIKTLRGERSDEFVKIHAQYGPTFEMKCLSHKSMVQTSSEKNLHAVTATNFNDWGVAPARHGVADPFMENGVFTDDGEPWRHARALIRPTFTRSEIADLDYFETFVEKFLALIPEDGTEFDLLPLAKRLFLDTSSEFILGQSVNSLLPETPPEELEFLEAFDHCLVGLALRLVAGPLRPLFKLDPTWKPAYTKVHKFVDRNVQIALDRQREFAKTGKDPEKEGERKKYILLHQMAMDNQNALYLRAQIINVFFPARDTSALAIGNVMFEMARHPDVWEELRAEVAAIGDQKLTFELIKDLKYAKAIISETLRLHVPGTRILRIALKDTVLPVGGGPDQQSPLWVAKGTIIEMDLYAMHRSPKIWGDDAEEFRPSRWAPGRPLWEAKRQYSPFIGGIRICPAQQMVLAQLTYLLVRLAQEFKTIENKDPVYRYVEEIKMTVESRNGTKIAVVRA